jgi:signal transduction histidine kinase
MKTLLPKMLVCVLLSGWHCCAQNLPALNNYYSIVHYTDENGLPQNSVKSIAADHEGFIWLTTESGLVRFDGRSFFTFNKANSAITDNRFYDIEPDLGGSKRRLYAVGEVGNYMRIEKGIAVNDTSYGTAKLKRIPEIQQGVQKSHIAGGAPNIFLENPHEFLHYIMIVSKMEGTYYVVHRNNVEFFVKWKREWSAKTADINFKDFFSLKGKLYRFLANGEIEKFGALGSTKMRIEGDLAGDSGYKSGQSNYKMYWNNVSDQLFVLLGNRLYELVEQSESKWTSNLILDGFGFKENNISKIFYDRPNHRIFLGSLTRGLFVLTKRMFSALTISENDNDNNLYAQTVFQNNKVLTPKGVVLALSDNRTPVRSKIPALIAANVDNRRYMLTDRQGNIWLSNSELLFKYDATGTKLLRSWKLPHFIKTFYEGMDGRIWIVLPNKGLFYINPSEPGQILHTFVRSISVSGSLFLLQANSDTLWAAGHKGLFLVHLKTGKVVQVPGTEQLTVRGLYISPSDRNGVFLMTYEDGIFFYRHGKIVHFPLDEKKNLSAAHCMVEDKKGYLWVPTNKGLFQFAKSDLLRYANLPQAKRTPDDRLFYLYYARESGFNTNEFNGGCQPCAVTMADGTVSLPSLNGLVWFKPDQMNTELPDGSLVVDRVEVQGKSRLLTSDSVTFETSPTQVKFYLTTPFFGNVNSLRIDYALTSGTKDSANFDWIPLTSDDPVIRFSSLESGKYTLLIRKLNRFGTNNQLVKKIGIIVPMNWYETILAKIIYLASVLGAIYLVILYRTRFLRRRNSELEIRIRQRTQMLEETNRSLQLSQKDLSRQMQILNSLVGSISHDVRTPLRYLKLSADDIESRIGKKQYEKAVGIANSISGSAVKMVQMLDNLMSYIKLQAYGKEIKMTNVDLHSLIEEKAELFEPALAGQESVFQNDVGEGIFVQSNAQLLGVVIHNLIDNAIKHTFEGTIRIHSKITEGDFHLIVSDSGRGMPDHIAHWMNGPLDNESDVGPNDTINEFTGLGLRMVREVAKMIKAGLHVDNAGSTSVHIIFRQEGH